MPGKVIIEFYGDESEDQGAVRIESCKVCDEVKLTNELVCKECLTAKMRAVCAAEEHLTEAAAVGGNVEQYDASIEELDRECQRLINAITQINLS